VLAGCVDVLQVLVLLGIQLPEHPLEQHLGEADDRVERRPELVGHVGEELRLVTAGRPQLAIRRLQLGEQPDVLDGDDRLVGEGLEERGLSGGEELRLRTAEADRADPDAGPHQRNREDRGEAQAPGVFSALGKLIPHGLEIEDMDCPTVQHRSAHDRSAAERKEELTDDALGDRADLGDQEEPVTVTSIDGGVHRTAEAGGALRQGLEHGLKIGRRARNDAQNVGGRRLLLEGFGQRTLHLRI